MSRGVPQQRVREMIERWRSSGSGLIYDTHKLRSLLVNAGLTESKADCFVETYANHVRHRRRPSPDQLRKKFQDKGFSPEEADGAIRMLLHLLDKEVIAA